MEDPVKLQTVFGPIENLGSTGMSEPRSVDAGDALDYEVGRLTGNTDGDVSRAVRAAIPRIRAQAATEARRELRAAVEGLPAFNTFGAGIVRGAVNRAAVLRLIEDHHA